MDARLIPATQRQANEERNMRVRRRGPATLVALVVLSALAGVVMAIGPARRASRVDVLQAVAYE